MIAFKSDFPLVQFDCGRVVGFESAWLKSELTRAAERAGYSKWWLAEHVSESVATYLQLQCPDPVIAASRVSEAVCSVLNAIGYGEVAEHYQGKPPPDEIWLPELSRMADSGFELAFFELLKQRIDQLRESKAAEWAFAGLQPCVKMLQSAKSWSCTCEKLADEIVDFIREQASREMTEDRNIAIQIN